MELWWRNGKWSQNVVYACKFVFKVGPFRMNARDGIPFSLGGENFPPSAEKTKTVM